MTNLVQHGFLTLWRNPDQRLQRGLCALEVSHLLLRINEVYGYWISGDLSKFPDRSHN